MEKYKFLPHTADIKFQAFGNSLEGCFSSAFEALRGIMFKDLNIKKIKSKIKKKIEIKGSDLSSLLYNFLEEFLFLLDAEDFLSSKIEKIKINEKNLVLNAEISGDLASNYKFSNNVKAITYNDMLVKKDNNKYICQVVVDV